MKKLLLAFALLLAPTLASAQCNGVFPNNTVCGNITGTSNLPRATNPSAFQGSAGGTNGQIQYNNGGALGGFTMSGDVTVNTGTGVAAIQPNSVANADIIAGSANTVKGSLNGTTTSDLAVASCSTIYTFTQWLTGTGWQCGINPVLPSRAVAATLNLSAFGSIKTLGYATAGDGGGATFLNRTTTPFRDSFVTAVTLTGNGTSGCTNGTYRNVHPSGGTGTNVIFNLAVVGNVVTTVEIRETGGNGYTVGDVLTTTVTGCSTSVTMSVTTVSTPTCSFSDTASNHFQIVRDEGNWLNIRQCGAKVDYAGTDGTATNDFTSIQNALSYAADIHSPTIDGGGSAGTRVILPPGNALICGGVPLLLPQGVAIEGANMWASTIKICAAWGASANFMNICDPDTRASCFASYLRNFTLYAPFNLASNASVSAIYSNNIQQVDIIDRVAVYAGRRRCLTLETGYGGAALLGIMNFECTPGDTSTANSGIYINYGTTLVNMRNVHVETAGPNTQNGIEIDGGFVELTGFHTEGISTGIRVTIPGSTFAGMARLFNLSGGASCLDLVNRDGVANSVVVGGAVPNGCTNTVNVGPVTTPIVANTLF